MAIRTHHKITDRTWFITFTCYDWLPLFEITYSYDLVYNWLKIIGDKYQVKTLAFVIMPNHVHLVLYLMDDKVNLNTIISNAKRFMAYEIVDRLKERHGNILDRLAAACTAMEKSKGQKHKVFEPSFDAKVIYSLDFLYQKLDYIHHNPVSKKWSLCEEFTDYAHSSAAFYESGALHPKVSITDFREYWF